MFDPLSTIGTGRRRGEQEAVSHAIGTDAPMPISADQIPERVAKQWARRLKDTLTTLNLTSGITLSQAQHCVARQLGYADWHAYQATAEKSSSPTPVEAPRTQLDAMEVSPRNVPDDGVSLFTRDTLIQALGRERGLSPMQAYDLMVDLYHKGLLTYPRTSHATLPSFRYQYVVMDAKDIARALPECRAIASRAHWENAPPSLWNDTHEHHGILPLGAELFTQDETLTPDERWTWETVARRYLSRFVPPAGQSVLYTHVFMDQVEPLMRAWLTEAPDEAGLQHFQAWLDSMAQLKRVPHATAYCVRLRVDHRLHVHVDCAVEREDRKRDGSSVGYPYAGPIPGLAAWLQRWRQTPPTGDKMAFRWGPFVDSRRPLRSGEHEVQFLFHP